MIIFLFVILVFAAVLEYLSLRSGVSGVNVDFSLSTVRSEPGEEIVIENTVKNLSRMPVSYLCARTSFPLCAKLPEGVGERGDLCLCTVTEIYRFWLRRKISRKMPFSIEQRGVHIIAGKDIQRGDFLGLKTSTAHMTQRREVLIYPRRLESSALIEALGNYCGETSAQRWLIRDPILTIGIREYTGNEPMRTITWSQTARRGSLMVREFDFTRSMNCCLVFCTDGMTHDEMPLLDTCCSAVRTVCEELASRGVKTNFFTNAFLVGYPSDTIRRCTAEDGKMQELLDLLARATPLRCCKASQVADYCLNTNPDASAYVLLVPHDSAEAQQAKRILEQRTGIGAMLITADSLEVA